MHPSSQRSHRVPQNKKAAARGCWCVVVAFASCWVVCGGLSDVATEAPTREESGRLAEASDRKATGLSEPMG